MLDHVVLRVRPQIGKDGVQGFRAMPLGQNEPVAPILVRVEHIIVQILVIQRNRYLYDGQLAAEMPHADTVDKG